MTYHRNARTNVYQRKRIHHSPASYQAQAAALGVSIATIAKWKHRKDSKDRSSRPHRVKKALPEELAPVLKWLRQDWLLDLDTVWKGLQKTVFPQLGRSSVYRELVRLGLQDLKRLKALPPKHRGRFRSCPPGFLHLDVFYLPRIEGRKLYLYVAIDRATRLLCMRVYGQRDAKSAVSFLGHCRGFYPFRIYKILTDNGAEFSSNFYRTIHNQKAQGEHPFPRTCKDSQIRHVLTKVKHPWTNGLVERTGKTIKDETVHRFHYDGLAQLDSALYGFERYFNYHRPYRAMQGKTPYELVQEWYKKQPKRFSRKPTLLITTL